MKSLARSQAARRRAAAAVAVASVGGGYLGTQSAEAAIVSIDLTNVNGKDFTGVNAGLSDGGGPKTFAPAFGPGTGQLQFNVYNKSDPDYLFTGIKVFPSTGGSSFYYGGVANGGYASFPQNYAFGTLINGSTSNFSLGNYGNNTLFSYVYKGTHTAPIFNGYLGFLSSGEDGNGTNGVYGWIRATWDGTNFQFYSAAYESTPGVGIRAGDTGATAVPEIDPSGLASTLSLVMGSVAMLEQRRRKRAAVVVATALTA